MNHNLLKKFKNGYVAQIRRSIKSKRISALKKCMYYTGHFHTDTPTIMLSVPTLFSQQGYSKVIIFSLNLKDY